MARNISVYGNLMPQISQAAIHSHGNFYYHEIISLAFQKNQVLKMNIFYIGSIRVNNNFWLIKEEKSVKILLNLGGCYDRKAAFRQG